MKNIVFLVAMDYEIENIFDLNDWEEIAAKPFRVLKNNVKKNAYIIRTGVGKVNAAAATQYALHNYDPESIINLGVVGCVNKALDIGEVKQISECRFFDVDVTKFGYKLGQIPECDLISYVLIDNPDKPGAKIVSGDSFITDQVKLQDIIEEFSPDFIDMEIGAIAHTLHIHEKLSLLKSYKAPSDYSDASAANDFYKNEKKAFANLRALAAKVLTEQG